MPTPTPTSDIQDILECLVLESVRRRVPRFGALVGAGAAGIALMYWLLEWRCAARMQVLKTRIATVETQLTLATDQLQQVHGHVSGVGQQVGQTAVAVAQTSQSIEALHAAVSALLQQLNMQPPPPPPPLGGPGEQ